MNMEINIVMDRIAHKTQEGAGTFLSKILAENYELDHNMSNCEILEIIKSDLNNFKIKMKEFESEELESGMIVILPELIEEKYNYWYILMWIVGKHYVNVDKKFIPKFYLDLVEVLNKKEPGRTCYSVVDKLLLILE